MKAVHFFFLAFLLISQFAFSQTEVKLDTLIFSESWFNNLEEAKAHPEKVKYLDLSLQKFKTFPKEILTFKNAERLYLPFNYWAEVPDEIGTLQKLEILDLSGNYYLNRLPVEGISKLKNLKEFIIKDHKLVAGEIDKVRKALPGCSVVKD